MTADPYKLQRFVDAQKDLYASVCRELRQGSKTGHWMWFIFPQLRGLGSSGTADFFGISSRAEAEAYLKHPLLGPRLRECTRLVNTVEGRSAHQIFGSPDDVKLRSSMTLFAIISPEDQLFMTVLQKYFDGELDPLTVKKL